jgi:hypothetical protein
MGGASKNSSGNGSGVRIIDGNLVELSAAFLNKRRNSRTAMTFAIIAD